MRYSKLSSALTLVVVLFGCDRSHENVACVTVLRQIASAKNEWAYERGKDSNAVPTWQDITPYIYVRDGVPKCPDGGSYTIGQVGEVPHCSIMSHNICFGMFVVLDEFNVPVADVQISVLNGGKELHSCKTDTKGEANVALQQQRTPDLWSHGTEYIELRKNGYKSVRIALPTFDWPIQLQLHALTINTK